MAIPATAKTLGVIRDPRDFKPMGLDYLSQFLNAGEDVATFTITPSAAAVAAGMSFADSAGRQPAIESGLLKLWPLIDPAMQENAMFEGAGVLLDFKVFVRTTSSPYREDETTFLIRWAQK